MNEKMELLKGVTFEDDGEVHVSPLPQDVLIVWGDHDQIFPLKQAVELKELLGDKARLEVIKNTAHIPQVEDANKFNDIVIKFLAGHSNSLFVN
ncbi:alpha/beta-Hydrolases superfamily protein [Thalictrum thalictroides]|uniref:Alpha/beta-Hydrolases superfamily protein n=1 Tax=Thalictrum thalictroides TaxID=46969 RepID=A0A7J6WPI0_THATH|nr:alpha/beta-Hydrolases superfamily protein [Thalictrum thalictroides]